MIIVGGSSAAAYDLLKKRESIAGLQIAEGINLLDTIKNKVLLYKVEISQWPESNEKIFSANEVVSNRYIDNISIYRQLIVASYKQSEDVYPDFRGKSIAYIGAETNDGRGVFWICGSIDISLEHLPANCKRRLK